MKNENLASRHLAVSVFKSFVRIIGCLGTIVGVMLTEKVGTGIIFLSICLGTAEVLGILEELVDDRK